MPIKLILADDHPLVLKGLEALFSAEPNFIILAYCTGGEGVLQAVRQHQPDIVVLDVKMPSKDGLTVLKELRQQKVVVKAVVLTAELSEDDTLELIRLGVEGVVLKEMAPQLLIQCLYKVQAGERWLEKQSFSRVLNRVIERDLNAQQMAPLLTLREMQLVRLVTQGFDNCRIAEMLHISEGTVKVHLHHVYVKLGIKNRTALALFAQAKGII